MKFLKKLGKWFLIILLLLNIAIIVSGKSYIYKGIADTYLQGRTKPGISAYGQFENREVKAGAVQEWPSAHDLNKKEIPADILQKFKDYKTVAFLVFRDDSLRHEQYWDGYDQNSVSNSFSIAKTFVGVMTGIAISEGKIKSIDQPVGDFLPEFREGTAAKITIKHLLTMSSGINFNESYTNPLAYPAAAYYGSDLEKLTYSYDAVDEPGKVFKYLSGNTALLSFVLKKATGMTLSDYASEKLWKPLGARNTALWSLDHKDGVEKAYCCLNSNARDFARLGQLFLDSGRWKGKQIVPEDFVLASVKPANLLTNSGDKNQKYGYSWWLIPAHNGRDVFYARGILGQYIFVIPSKKMVVVRLGKTSEPGQDHPVDAFLYLDAALEMY